MRTFRYPPTITLTIEKIVPGGQGLGFYAPEGKKAVPVFVHAALPGEVLTVRIAKQNRKAIHATIETILTKSPLRQETSDPAYESTSPWQVIPYDEQLTLKTNLTQEVFQSFAGTLPLPSVTITKSPSQLHYRNKMEFSFADTLSGVTLAFNRRHRFQSFIPTPEGSPLAHPAINFLATTVQSILRSHRIPASSLKNLLVRASFSEGNAVARLFVTTPDFPPLPFPDTVSVYYSDPTRSIALPTQHLAGPATHTLTERIADTTFTYGLENFFQVNPPAAALLIDTLTAHLPTTTSLLDLYAGVGFLGLSLRTKTNHLTFVELEPTSYHHTEHNIAANHVKHATVITSPTESSDLPALLTSTDTVIIDPPRSGLHPKVTALLTEHPPKTLIYLSCDPATQARDYALLKDHFTVSHWQLLDFYPSTPHTESLLILHKK